MSARELEQLVEAELGSALLSTGPWLLLSPHPDDETIGASWLMQRAPRLTIAYITDGSPRDPTWWARSAPPDREAYARVRQEEARRALSLVSIAEDKIVRLGFIDQEASLDLELLTWSLVDLILTLAPSIVVVPPYEGGHPDHDATCFAAHAAQQILSARTLSSVCGSVPCLLEMSSYHRRDGMLRSAAFLQGSGGGTTCTLSAADRSRKTAMLACFVSQKEALAPFTVEQETFRAGPSYDFTRPCHDPPIHYETLRFPLTGSTWRQLAASAQMKLGCSWANAGTPCR